MEDAGESIERSCIMLSKVDTLYCQQKELQHKENKGKSKTHVLYTLQLAKK